MTEKKKPGPEAIVREIKRNTRRKFSSEEKIRIVLGSGVCCENYHASGSGGNDPHYTWEAKLCLIGLEEICDIEPDGKIRLSGKIDADFYIHNLPIGGNYYDARVSNKRMELHEKNQYLICYANINRIIVALGAISILPTLGQKGAKPKLSEK